MVDRGAIHWAELEPTRGHEQAGRRPVLIVSRTSFNQASGTAIVFPLTGQPQRLAYPFTAPVPQGVLDTPSWVKLTKLRTLDTARLGSRLASVPDAFVRHCLFGLLRHCGL